MNAAIDKFLKDYFVIDKNKTEVDSNTGTFIIHQIKVKDEIFKNLNLPFFEIKNSFIGKISFTFSKIMTTHPEDYPIYIGINEIFINMAQKGINDWSEDQKLEEFQMAKKSVLSNLENYFATYLENKNSQDDSNSSDFTKKLMNNLNLRIGNLVIRFEDDVSYPAQPYALTLILKDLNLSQKVEEKREIVQTTKKNENNPKNEVSSIKKTLNMDDFSIYMDIFNDDKGNDLENFITEKGTNKAKQIEDYFKDDINYFNFYAYCVSEIEDHIRVITSHNFLLYKLDLFCNAIYNPDYQKNKLPFFIIDLSIERFNFSFDLNQIKILLKFQNYLSFINDTYYYSIIETHFEKNMLPLTAKNYLDIYVKYFDKKYFEQKLPEEYKSLSDNLEPIEKLYTLEYLRKIRYLAYERLEYLCKLRFFEKKIAENSSFSLFNNEDQKKNKEIFEIKKAKLEEDDEKIKQELEECIEYVNDNEKLEREEAEKQQKFREEEKKLLDKNYIKNKCMINIKFFKLSLLSRVKKINDYKKNKNKRYNKDYFDSYIKTFKNDKIDNNLNNNNYIIDREEKKISNVNKYLLTKKYKTNENLEDYIISNNNNLIIDENEDFLQEENKENKKVDESILNLNSNIIQAQKIMVLNKIKSTEEENDENIRVMETEINKFSFFDFQFQNFELFFNVGLEKIDLFLFLGDLCINQYISNHKNFTKILESKLEIEENINENSFINDNLNLSNKKNPTKNFIDENILEKIEKKYDNKKGAIFISFQMDPDLPNSSYRFRLRNSKRLYFNYDPLSINLISFLMKEVLNSEIDLESISKNASQQSYENIMHGYDVMQEQIKTGDYKPFSMHVDVVFKGPKFIVPQDILNQDNKSCLLLSMGVVSIKSLLANRISDEKIDVSTLKFYNDLFDMYDLNIKGFELNIIYDYGKYLKEIEHIETGKNINTESGNLNNYQKKLTLDFNNNHSYIKTLNIIEKVDFNLFYSQLIEPKNIFHEKAKLGMQLNQISINLNEPIIEYLANTIYYMNYFNIFYDDELEALKLDENFIILSNKKIKNTNVVSNNEIKSIKNNDEKSKRSKRKENDFKDKSHKSKSKSFNNNNSNKSKINSKNSN
jgi:hypothetical protein